MEVVSESYTMFHMSSYLNVADGLFLFFLIIVPNRDYFAVLVKYHQNHLEC